MPSLTARVPCGLVNLLPGAGRALPIVSLMGFSDPKTRGAVTATAHCSFPLPAKRRMQQLLHEQHGDARFHDHHEKYAVGRAQRVRAVVDVAAAAMVHVDRIAEKGHR